jgi:hypothetical protein
MAGRRRGEQLSDRACGPDLGHAGPIWSMRAAVLGWSAAASCTRSAMWCCDGEWWYATHTGWFLLRWWWTTNLRRRCQGVASFQGVVLRVDWVDWCVVARTKVMPDLCWCRHRRRLRVSFSSVEASLCSSDISPTLGVFSPGVNLNPACRIGNGGILGVASLLKASFWRQLVVLALLCATLFVLAEGLSLGAMLLLWCFQDGVFLKIGLVPPLACRPRRSTAKVTLAQVVLI